MDGEEEDAPASMHVDEGAGSELQGGRRGLARNGKSSWVGVEMGIRQGFAAVSGPPLQMTLGDLFIGIRRLNRVGYIDRPRFERADVWWASLLRTRFEDGAIEVAWDEFVRLFRAKFIPEHIQDRMDQEFLSLTQGSMTVLEYEAMFAKSSKYAPHIMTDERRKAKKFVMGLKPSLRTRLVAFDHRTLDEALSAACRQEGEMQQYLEEKKASQKRPAATFQWQDKKKAVYQAPQCPVTTSSAQVPSQRSPGVKKECPH
ncbi:hypothetical protein Taro_051989 [Colocasia esculenta]|uniref:Retrotransposon gag domain-containing protein n=1 Tax=Colocasia esculenta TaxID=4460 RepID=A0A843XHG1_COLES|nr:hypothetical protein [Colocasia esculenta]